jgi:hypothetical protein
MDTCVEGMILFFAFVEVEDQACFWSLVDFVAATNRPSLDEFSSSAIGSPIYAEGHATLILRYCNRRVGSSVAMLFGSLFWTLFRRPRVQSIVYQDQDELKTNKAVAWLDLGNLIAFVSRNLYSCWLTRPVAVGEPSAISSMCIWKNWPRCTRF